MQNTHHDHRELQICFAYVMNKTQYACSHTDRIANTHMQTFKPTVTLRICMHSVASAALQRNPT